IDNRAVSGGTAGRHGAAAPSPRTCPSESATPKTCPPARKQRPWVIHSHGIAGEDAGYCLTAAAADPPRPVVRNVKFLTALTSNRCAPPGVDEKQVAFRSRFHDNVF